MEEVCAALPHYLRLQKIARCVISGVRSVSTASLLCSSPHLWGSGRRRKVSFCHLNSLPGQVSGCWKKALYHITVKTLNVQSLAGMEESRWTDFFDPDIFLKGSWWSLYKLPVEKWAADLQWRIVHGVMELSRILGGNKYPVWIKHFCRVLVHNLAAHIKQHSVLP